MLILKKVFRVVFFKWETTSTPNFCEPDEISKFRLKKDKLFFHIHLSYQSPYPWKLLFDFWLLNQRCHYKWRAQKADWLFYVFFKTIEQLSIFILKKRSIPSSPLFVPFFPPTLDHHHFFKTTSFINNPTAKIFQSIPHFSITKKKEFKEKKPVTYFQNL